MPFSRSFAWPGAARHSEQVIRLRPEWGFGDHLMLAAIIEAIKAEHPGLGVHVAADHPEIFWHNPHVDMVVPVHHLRRRDPRALSEYREILRRPPGARYLQTAGHLLDDMYDSVGVPVRQRAYRPRIYLTWWESRYAGRTLSRLPRPRVAVAAHGTCDVKLPNKIYPPGHWGELARLLAALGGSVLQLGARTEGPLLPEALDYRDLGYRRTAAVLSRCDVLVTHVGGLMHLGAALRIPSVILYGAAEHPAVSGYPWNRNLYTPIECGPCWMTQRCAHHSCMRRLAPPLVRDETVAVLNGAPLETREFPATVEMAAG